MIQFLLPDVNISLDHRQKIVQNPSHPLHSRLPQLFNPICNTRQTVNLNRLSFTSVRCSTEQFLRSFFLACVKIWNMINDYIVHSNNVQMFKFSFNCYISSQVS